MAVTEYLESEIGSAVRREYVGGQVYAMAGSSPRYSRIAGNIHAHFWQLAQNRPCRVRQEAVKLRIGTDEDPEVAFYYPDVMVVCDKTPPHEYCETEPCILVEVLSPSTVNTDLREKYPRVHLPTQPAHLFGGGSGHPVRAALVPLCGGALAPPRPYRRWSDSAPLFRWPDLLTADLCEGV